jgi:hypothetical protein
MATPGDLRQPKAPDLIAQGRPLASDSLARYEAENA